MKKIISFILGSIVALNLSMSVANSAANEVRVAFFLEWPTPNQEDKVKGLYEKALGLPPDQPPDEFPSSPFSKALLALKTRWNPSFHHLHQVM